jgi:HAD superfamily hydrolase (TIGR01459 family)
MRGFVIGIDLGTSGVRAAAVDVNGKVLALGTAKLPPTLALGARREQHPDDWWVGVKLALRELGKQVDLARARAIAVAGTSGTIVPVDAENLPLAAARMYDDADTGDLPAKLRALAPRESAAHGATSPAARALGWVGLPGLHRILHQADWVNRQLGATEVVTDENNALKTGYDPVARAWPDWLRTFGLDPALLPTVVPVGAKIGELDGVAANTLGLPAGIPIAAGTTDGCATFLASGAQEVGDGATALGSTLVLKLLCDRPIFAPEYGIYSHRLGDRWLAGGASNCGGRTLANLWTAEELVDLTGRTTPEQPTGLSYYPLPATGERFPIADANLAPRLAPRPTDDARFLQGILEGLAEVERLGYQRLRELGGPALRSIRHAGGGARNPAWMKLRARALGITLDEAASEEAAAGVARLAWRTLGETVGGHVGLLRPHAGLAALAPSYDVLLVDQFGTLHDGQKAYAGAAEALRRFRAGGGKVVVLSNSAKSGADNRVRLAKFGFDARHFDAVVTSGDAAQAAIREGRLGRAFKSGARVHLSGKPGDDYGFGALGLRLVGPDECEAIVLTASAEPDRPWGEQVAELAGAARRGVPVLVANPDLEMLTPAGVRPSAGAVARELEKLGARLLWFGKPYADIYRVALAAAGDPDRSQVLTIGDSPEHDLAGAARAGLAGALLGTGILQGRSPEELGAWVPLGEWAWLPELRW